MSTPPPAPSRSELSERFTSVLAHEQSREAVDQWAAQWAAVDPDTLDAAVAWGLEVLQMIEGRHGPGESYLYTDDQIAGWFDEYMARCSERP